MPLWCWDDGRSEVRRGVELLWGGAVDRDGFQVLHVCDINIDVELTIGFIFGYLYLLLSSIQSTLLDFLIELTSVFACSMPPPAPRYI